MPQGASRSSDRAVAIRYEFQAEKRLAHIAFCGVADQQTCCIRATPAGIIRAMFSREP